MAQWGNTDDAANSVLWAASQLNKPANTDNQTALFGNTTADAFVTGVTTGQFGVDVNEAQAARAGEQPKAAHSGWVLRTVGSGGRAGRVTNEVLVAMNTITTGSDAEDVVFKDYKITITSNPSNASANSTANEIATFTVAGATTPTGGTLVYAWQRFVTANSTWVSLTNAGAYSNTTTATLSVLANTAPNGEKYRAIVGAGGATATSANAALTVTS